MKKIWKNGKLYIIGIIIVGIAIGLTTVVADTIINSTSIAYKTTTVKAALDELYEKANSDSFWLKKYKTWAGTPTNYILSGSDKPTTSSPTTPPSGKNVYLGLYADGQYGVCIKRNGTQHCFRYNNWIAEAKHVQEVFSDISCVDEWYGVSCHASNFYCNVYSGGGVECMDEDAPVLCRVNGDGSVNCMV